MLILYKLALISSCICQYVSTFAGSGVNSFADGQGTSAMFSYLYGIVSDTLGNLYVVDCNNNRIRKVTPSAYVSTLAGSSLHGHADNQSTNAIFNYPTGIAIDAIGNLYVTDRSNNMIRKINVTGYVSTIAGNSSASYIDDQGSRATFNYPTGLTSDPIGNLYVADSKNNAIRMINVTGYVTTWAGSGSVSFSDGQGEAASFNNPYCVTIDALGNLYVSDSGNNRIRRINTTGYVSTVAGSIQGYSDDQDVSALLNNPHGLAFDTLGNVYFADSGNNRIRKINATGYVSTVAGSVSGYADGTNAKFSNPLGLTIDPFGNLFVTDNGNAMIRKINFSLTKTGYLATTTLTVLSTSTVIPITTVTDLSTSDVTDLSTSDVTDLSTSTVTDLSTSTVTDLSTSTSVVTTITTASLKVASTLLRSKPTTSSTRSKTITTTETINSNANSLTNTYQIFQKQEYLYSAFVGFGIGVVGFVLTVQRRKHTQVIRRRMNFVPF